jgi:uncharacterized protein YdhG (YjbR/CyaY superfamily)
MSASEVDDYIKSYSPEIQEKLKSIRQTVLFHVPDAEESISYGLPTFKIKGKPLMYFAAFKNHIGLYALPTTHEAFSEKLKDYKQGKGSVQFPYNRPLQLGLIEELLIFRIKALKSLHS